MQIILIQTKSKILKISSKIILVVGFFFLLSSLILVLTNTEKVDAAINNTMNYQSKIVNKTTGLNIASGTPPACVKTGAGVRDTCDFQVRIWNHLTNSNVSTDLMYTETFQDVEISDTDGIFNLVINSSGSATLGTSQWGTAGSGSATINGYSVTTSATVVDDSIDTDTNPGVNFNRSDLYIEIGFATADTSGSLGSFTEIFTRTNLRSVPSAFVAQTLGGIGADGFVQIAPAAAQTTGNTTNTIINLNENGAGGPDLINMAVGGTTVFNVDNSGDIQIGSNTANILGLHPEMLYAWADREDSGTGSPSANGVATDTNGNIYVVGNFTGAVDFGAGSWTASGSDYFIVKYNSSGVFQWADRENSGTGDAYAIDAATDSGGNVYVTGYFLTAAIDFGAGSWTPSGTDYFVIKYNSSGTYQWADRENSGTGTVYTSGIATDSSNNVYVSGYFYSSAVDFGAGSWTPSSYDYFLIKYNSSGTYQWADREDSGTGDTLAEGVATDTSGNVYVAGWLSGASTDIGAGSWTPSGSDYFVIKYNSSGTYQWADRENSGTGDAKAHGIATDANGDVYVVGYFISAAVDFGAGSWTPSGLDYFVIGYDSTGAYRWADREDGGPGRVYGLNVATSDNGNVYVTGYFQTQAVDFGEGSWTPTNNDYFVVAYTFTGAYQWTDREDSGAGSVYAYDIAVDSSNNVYVAGYFDTAAVDFGAGSWTPSGTDYFIAKYSPASGPGGADDLYWGNLRICLEDGTNCPETTDVSLYNKSGGTLNTGSLVIQDTTNDNSFTTTTTANDLKVIGVLQTNNCANNGLCTVRVEGKATMTASASVNRGEYIYTSTTAGAGVSNTSYRSLGLIGVALSSDTGSPYSVEVMVTKSYTGGGVSLNPSTPDTVSAGSGNSIYINNAGEGGNLLNLQDDGTSVVQVTTEGNTTIGNQLNANDGVDLTVYGDILQGSNTELSGITDITDIFIYDTTKDSDGGAWTNSDFSKTLSWATEAKDDGPGDVCNVSTDDRCGKGEFPKKAIIIATTSNVYIFDAMSNKMWMKFSQGTNYALGADTSNDPSSSWAVDGSIYISTNGASGTGMYEINLKKNLIYRYNTTNRSDIGPNMITDRNSAVTYANAQTSYAIAGNVTNAVMISKINGTDYATVASDAAISVINLNLGVVHDYSDVTSDHYNAVWLKEDGTLYALNETQAQLEKWNAVQNDTADELNGTPDRVWDETTTPAFRAVSTIQTNSNDLYAKGDKVYVGTNQGVYEIKDIPGDEENGSIKYYLEVYITEEMVGDVRTMTTMIGGTIGTQPAANTTIGFLDASIKANPYTTLASGTEPTNASGVRGVGFSFDGGDYICTGTTGTCADDADLDFAAANNFSISVWIKMNTVSAANTIVSKGGNGTTDGIGYAIYTNTTGNVICGIDDDATTFPDDSVTSTNELDDNQWHHVVCTKSGTTALRLFVDGKETGTADEVIAATGTLDNADALRVGANRTNGEFFAGVVDELTITAEELSASQIEDMYSHGKQAIKRRQIEVIGATTYTTTTIGNSAETWLSNEFVGGIVEIVGGTGAGQTRKVISNSTSVLTVSPAWTTTPGSGSTFVIRSQRLYGASRTVKAIDVEGSKMYVGTNSGTDTGGVSVVDLNSDSVIDVYHGGSGKGDDSSVSWGSTYDDITAIDVDSELVTIGSDLHYWEESVGVSVVSEIGKLDNEVEQLQNNSLTDTSRQNDGMNVAVSQQVVRKGWGWITSTATTNYLETVNYGISYDDVPIVISNYAGYAGNTADPTRIEDCAANSQILRQVAVNRVTVVDFEMRMYRTVNTADAAGNRFCYSWLAIGTYKGSGGADLAENYLTYDLSLESGDIVGIDLNNDISVVKTEKTYDQNAIGVVATKPSITIGPADGTTPGVETSIMGNEVCGDTSPLPTGQAVQPSPQGEGKTSQEACGKTVPVALAGRVPVKVTLENGPIKRGDYLTASSVPGFAMKATNAGMTIGRALENFDGSSSIVNTDEELSQIDQLIETRDLRLETIIEQTSESSLQSPVSDIASKVLFGGMSKETIKDANVRGKVMMFVQGGYYWGEVANNTTTEAGSVVNPYEEVEGVDVGTVLGIGETREYIGPIEDTANIGSYTLGGLVIRETDGSINTIGESLKLQSISDKDVEIYNGKIRLTADGSIFGSLLKVNTLSLSSITLIGDAHGEVVIPASQDSITVNVPEEFEGYIVILTPQTEMTSTYSVKKSEKSFEIHLGSPEEFDVTMEYILIETTVKEHE